MFSEEGEQHMKISEVTYEDVANYIKVDELSEQDIEFLNILIVIAKTFIQNYTGRSAEEVDSYPDFVIVMFILCQDMWDNRSLYVDDNNINYVVETILGMHSVNLL